MNPVPRFDTGWILDAAAASPDHCLQTLIHQRSMIFRNISIACWVSPKKSCYNLYEVEQVDLPHVALYDSHPLGTLYRASMILTGNRL